MNVSNDFAVRTMGLYTTQIPEDKDDVTDEAVDSIFMKIMSFQTFVDISRCKKLSPSVVKYFDAGMTLLYLDISYTRVNRLETICTNCVNLKAINLAGLEMLDRDYKALESLLCAELINMRSSNVQNIQCLSQLHCLRSLDLGHTSILNINPLTNKTRLEELLLDHCNVTEFQKNKYFVFQALHSLTNLKLFNYCNSEIAQYSIQIRKTIKSDYHLEPMTRREKFFQAIVDNDTEKLIGCITSGQDIDMRSIPEDLSFFTSIYKARCISKYTSTPFVLCNHSNEECRPSGIHLAILFNAYDCFQILMDHNVRKDQSVWFGDVSIIDNMLQATPDDKLLISINSSDSAMLGRNSNNVYNTKDLINQVFLRNMHRITERMFEKKIANWKTLCANINKRLLYMYDTTRVGKRMTTEQLDLRNSFAFSAELEDNEGNLLLENGEEEGALINIEDGNSTKENKIQTGTSGTNVPAGTSAPADLVMVNTAGNKLARVMQEVATAVSVTTALTPVTDLGAMPVKKKRVSLVDPTVVKGPKKLIPERKPTKYLWRNHAMVRKLASLPEVITEKVAVKQVTKASMSTTATRASASAGTTLGSPLRSSTGTLRQSWAGGAMNGNDSASQASSITYKIKETAVLGKKSYWLESRKHWAFEKAHREAADYCSDDEDTEEGLDTIHIHHKFFKNDPHPNAHKHPHDHKLDHSDAALKDFKQSIVDLHADQAKQAKLAMEQKLADAKAREIERRRLEEEQRAAFEDYIQNFHVKMEFGASASSSSANAEAPTLTTAAAAAVDTSATALIETMTSPIDGEDSESRMSSPDNISRARSVSVGENFLASPSRDDTSVGEGGGGSVKSVSAAPVESGGAFVKPAPLKRQLSTTDRKSMLVKQISMRFEERQNKALEG